MDSVKENYKNVFSTKFSIKCYTEEQEENWDSFDKTEKHEWNISADKKIY